MSKVEETIEQYESRLEVCMNFINKKWACKVSSLPEINKEAEVIKKVIANLEEIQAEQEELQKRIEFLEKLSELNNETIEKLQATSKKLTNKLKEQSKSVEIPQSMTKKMDKLLKELDDPEKFDQFIEGYHAFVDKDKPVVLPPFIIETMKNYDSLQNMLTEEYYSDCDSSEEIFDDSVYCWIADNFDLLCLAWTTGNYTVKQEQLYRVKYSLLFFERWEDDKAVFIIPNNPGWEKDAYKGNEKQAAEIIKQLGGGASVKVEEEK